MSCGELKGATTRRWPLALLVTTLLLACTSSALKGYERTSEARRLTATLQAQFAAAVSAADRAVVSTNGETSAREARAAEAARQTLKESGAELTKLLAALEFSEESRLLKDFDGKFAGYEALDRSILALALEKTNTKATHLAFGKGREAAQDVKQALGQISGKATGGSAWQTRALTQQVVVAVAEIQALEPPHIAEPNDQAMTRMEEEMRSATSSARSALSELADLVGKDKLEPANTALVRFLELNDEVITLSRRNSDVRSLELTLGQKRTLVTACQESLATLAESLRERITKPTR